MTDITSLQNEQFEDAGATFRIYLFAHKRSNKKLFSSLLGANVTVITALANASVSLPCDISTPNVHERVTFILWYREDLGIPIYR